MFDSRQIKAVLWDIDGTLVDSEPTHHTALLACSKALGADLSGIAHDRFIGVHMKDVWREVQPLFPGHTTFCAWLSRIEQCYVELIEQVTPMPDARETIHHLSKTLAQAAVSNSGRMIVDANLVRLGVRDKLAFAISLDDVERGKPDPLPYQKAAQALGLHPSCIVAVEDSNTGIQSAKNAGIWTVSCANPPLPADAHILRLAQLPPLLGVADVQD